MIDVHVIRVDDDGSVVLDVRPAGPGRYRLQDSAALRGALRTAEATTGPGDEPTPQGAGRAGRRPGLSPAQVQARLRAGVTPEDVARDADVDLAWVARWAGPVEAEKREMVRGALATQVIDEDHGLSEATLGELVQAWLPRGTPGEDLDWLVARRRDGRWRVTLRVPTRSGVVTATWIWSPRSRELVAASARARRISHPDG